MANHVLVIGAGPAGLEAARAAAMAGARVTLVSEGPIGGRAGWDSLIPSKVWLAAADSFGQVEQAAALGVALSSNPRPDPVAVLARIRIVADDWSIQQTKGLNNLGVEIITGVAVFEAPHQVTVKQSEGETGIRLKADAVIIATGSTPFFPPNLKPDGKRILAPRFASHLESLPDDIIVIGAGATGSEFTYLFNRLGIKVTWIVDSYGVLPAFAPAAGRFLAETLTRRGVNMVVNQLADRLEADDAGVTVVTANGAQVRAAMVFVAIGRFPDLSRLNLAAVGLPVPARQALPTDHFGRSPLPAIYAVGDAAGMPMLANRAMAQAWVAGRHAAGVATSPFRPETVIQAIYTEPQVAQVGRVAGEELQTVRLSFNEGLKAHLLPEGEGLIELAYDRDRRVAGAVAVGPHAADALAPVALAIQMRASLDDLAAVHGAHPTVSELAFMAARSA